MNQPNNPDNSVSYIAEKPTVAFKKAILRTTGEVVYVRPTTRTIQHRMNIYEDADGRDIAMSMLSFAPEVDWEQRRYEASVTAMQGLIASRLWNATDVAKEAVKYADALIEELRKTQSKE